MNVRRSSKALGSRHAFGERERGIAAVEFAISMGVILLLMLATAELARAYYSYNTLVKAVRNGSRYLSDTAYNGTTGVLDLTAPKRSRTANMVVHGDITGTRPAVLPDFDTGMVSISSSEPTGPFSPYISIVANYPYVPLMNVVPGFGFGTGLDVSFTMQADSTMRVQN